MVLGCWDLRYKLWWCVKGDGVGGAGVIKKGELCEKVEEVRWLSDRMIAVMLVRWRGHGARLLGLEI